MNKSIEVYPKTSKMILLSFVALIFVVLGILIGVNRVALEINLFLVVITSYIGVPFFGFCFLYIIYRIIKKRPSLIVNSEGITDNSSAISCGFIKWYDIDNLFIYDFMGQKFLGIIPKDYQAFIANITPIKRKLIQINKRMVKAPINITQNTVAVPLEQIVQYAREYIELDE
jgi:hypothetical protein